MAGTKKTTDDGNRVVASNRQARRDYEILETFEAGIVLRGSEVKSLREAKVQLNDAYVRIVNGEMWLLGLHVAPYSHATGVFGHETDRQRKLLVHRHEILRLRARVDQERLALVPLSMYFTEGRAKVEVALGKGRTKGDKRQALAKKEAESEARAAMNRARKGND
jgi:SsrA-binding protein